MLHLTLHGECYQNNLNFKMIDANFRDHLSFYCERIWTEGQWNTVFWTFAVLIRFEFLVDNQKNFSELWVLFPSALFIFTVLLRSLISNLIKKVFNFLSQYCCRLEKIYNTASGPPIFFFSSREYRRDKETSSQSTGLKSSMNRFFAITGSNFQSCSLKE